MITLAKDKHWHVAADREGFLFQFTDSKVLRAGIETKSSPILQERAAILRVLEEQGAAEPIHDGMSISWENASLLQPSTRETLDLPPPWSGSLVVRVNGLSHQNDFDLFFDFVRPNRKAERGVQPTGALISIGSERYLASYLQFRALDALQKFKEQKEHGTLDQYSALSTLEELRSAKAGGLDINLDAYDELEIVKPDAIRIAVGENSDGSLILTPDLCQKNASSLGARSMVDPVDFENRYEGYISDASKKACVPVDKTLVLLDEKAVEGIREITRNKHISPERREAFLKEPTAWINAQYVDLDLGFSSRVRGAAPLKVAYFGETDESGIQWLEPKAQEESKEPKSQESGESENDILEEEEDSLPAEPVVLDIELADEGESPEESRSLKQPERSLVSVRYPDISKLLRSPFPHQLTAIRWLMALAMNEPGQDKWKGALLADDMGLGKTFSVLAFLREFISDAQEKDGVAKPCLIVAPVSLLSVWNKELHQSLSSSPFSDLVILHSSEDLSRFKRRGSGREVGAAEPEINAGTTVDEAELDTSIRYSLRLAGDSDVSGPDCLGLPNSIIITNYETVRDYQFSLARIPWSVVVLDEAQAIKNPNAMVTRAAKALNADFAVVMTGTPVENSLKDFWCLMDRVQPGYLNNYQPFRKEFVAPILKARRQGQPEDVAAIRNQIGDTLRDRVGGLMLRRLKADHLDGLPSKTVILHNEEGIPSSGHSDKITCQMPPYQQSIYDQICTQSTNSQGEDDRPQSQCILAAIQNLRTASLHPDLIVKNSIPIPKSKTEALKSIEKSGKLAKLISILESIQVANEKVLIFAITKRLQIFLQSALQLYFDLETPPGIINGDTKIKQSKRSSHSSRTTLIDDFSARSGFDILILSPVAAGVGLTITAANHVVHLERHWNPAKEAQATDRVYRIGQTKPVSVWVPILLHPEKESFDQKLDKLLTLKSGLSEAVVTPDSVDASELADILGGSKAPQESYIQPFSLPGLKWDLFEAFVAELIATDDAERVILSPAQNDKGCDVIAIGWRGENWLIQCKHKQDPTGIVGHSSVREIVGSRSYYAEKLNMKFKKLAVFSNVKKFDKNAKEFAKRDHVDLFGLREINKMTPKKGLPLSALLARNGNREKV